MVAVVEKCGRINRIIRSLGCLISILYSASSSAHAPIEGVGYFYNGILHPFLVPPHFLLIAVLGLYMGQKGIQHTKWIFNAFILGNLIGLVIAYIFARDGIQSIFLIVAAVVGVLVCANQSLPHPIMLILTFVMGYIPALIPCLMEWRDGTLSSLW